MWTKTVNTLLEVLILVDIFSKYLNHLRMGGYIVFYA